MRRGNEQGGEYICASDVLFKQRRRAHEIHREEKLAESCQLLRFSFHYPKTHGDAKSHQRSLDRPDVSDVSERAS